MASEVERRADALQKDYEKLEGVSIPLAKLLGRQFAFLETILQTRGLVIFTDEDKARIQALMSSGRTGDALAELQELNATEFRSGEAGLTGTN